MNHELWLPPVRVNPINNRFQKGHVPANKGKKWDEYMPKQSQRRAAKGWKTWTSTVLLPIRRPHADAQEKRWWLMMMASFEFSPVSRKLLNGEAVVARM